MKNLRVLAMLCLFGLSAALGIVSSTAQTANFLVQFKNFGLQSNAVYRVTVQGLNWTASPTTFYVNPPTVISAATYPAMTNGSVIFSNMMTGVPYTLTLSGYSDWTTNFLVYTNDILDANGNFNIAQRVGLYGDPSHFYFSGSPIVSAGGSATNALAEGPGGIYDASLITNVQATAIVGVIRTNNLPMSQLGGGGSGGTVAFDFNGTTNLITSDGSGNLAAQSFTDGTGASLGGGILDMTINMRQEGIWMSPGSGDGNMLQFYAPAIPSNPNGYFLLGCMFFDSFNSTDGRILGWENLGYTNTDGTYGGWFEQSCACSVDWYGRSNDGYWFTVPLNSFGQSLFGLLGNVMWPDANPYLIPPGIVDIFVPPGGYTNTAAIWMQPAQKSANPAAGILENDGTNYFICKTNSNGKLTVTPLMTRDDLTNGLSTFYGNASGLTNLSAAQLTGTVPLAALGNAITNQQSGVVLTNLLSYDGGQSWQYSASGYARIFTNATIPSSVAIGLGAVKASATLTGSNVVANGVIFGNGAGISNISNIAISQNLQISDLAGDSMSGGTITAINALIDGSGDSMSGGTIYAPTKFSTPGSYYGSGVTVVSGTVTNTIGNIVSFGGTFYGNLAGGTNLPAAGVTNAAGFWAAMPAPTLTYSNITALGTNAYSISGGVVVDDDRSLVATNDPRSITLPNLTATVETWGTNNFTMNQYGPNEYDLRYDGTNLMQLFGHSTPLAVSLPSASLSVSNNITLAGGGSAVNGVGFTNGVIAGAMNASNITGTINATIIGTPTFNGQNITNMSATNVSGTFGSISTSGSLSVGGTITGNANGLTNLPWGTGYSVSLLGASISTNVAGVSKWFTMNGTILSSPSTSGIFVATPLQPGTYGMFKAFLSPTITMAATTNITMLFCTNSWGNGVPVSTGVTFTWSGPIASYSVSGSLYQTNYATTISVQDGSYGCWLITNNATASQVANGAVQAIISASMLFHQ